MGIRTKLLFPLMTILIVIIASVELYWLPTLTEQEVSKQIKNQTSQLNVLEIALIDPILNADLAHIHLVLDEILTEHPEWKWLVLKEINGDPLYPIFEQPDIADGDHVFKFKHPVKYSDVVLGNIYLSADLTESIHAFERQLRILDWLLLVLLPLVAIASAVLQDRFVRRPLHQLAGAATRIAHGDFNVQLPKATTDEVGQLVLAFDGMCKMRNTAQSALEELAYFDMLTR